MGLSVICGMARFLKFLKEKNPHGYWYLFEFQKMLLMLFFCFQLSREINFFYIFVFFFVFLCPSFGWSVGWLVGWSVIFGLIWRGVPLPSSSLIHNMLWFINIIIVLLKRKLYAMHKLFPLFVFL